MKKVLIFSVIAGLMLVTAGTVLADTTETIDIGDTISETTYMADGWGPIQSGWGGNSGKFRVIWEPSLGSCEDVDKWASVTLPTMNSSELITSITIKHLDGRTNDSFRIYINGVEVNSYNTDSDGIEIWETTTFPVSGEYIASEAVIKLEATAPAWSLCGTYGQVAIDSIEVNTTFVRSAEITSPAVDEVVSGLVFFEATLDDEDGNDNVSWAVRQGTCAAGVGTVFGNVDGHSDAYDWDGASFQAEADTSTWVDGDYCFIFNPTESAGDLAIRETQEFVIDNDADDDSVANNNDFCPATTYDEFKRVNPMHYYWSVDNKDQLFSMAPSNGIKAKSSAQHEEYSISDTHGCSCVQVLKWLENNYPEEYGELNGLKKFGCSSGVMKDFITLSSNI